MRAEAAFPEPVELSTRGFREAPLAEVRRKAVRQVLRAILGAGLIWLALMIYTFLQAPH